MCEAFAIDNQTVNFYDWICDHCCLSYRNDKQLIDQLENDKQSTIPIIAQRSRLIEQILKTLKNDGVVFTKDIMIDFRQILTELNVDASNHARLWNSLRKYISTITQDKYAMFTPIDKLGKAIYDRDKFTTHSLMYIFNMKQEKWNGHKDLRQLIKNQSSKFPTSKSFNYTQLVTKEGIIELDSYFDPELVSAISSITTHSSEHDYNKCSNLFQDLRASRIKMIIALMCFTMNPSCCFLQTLVGLACYAYGLRDKGFEVLNALGCTASIDHIRAHGSFWAKNRKAINELEVDRFWRTSIDNLNFNIKFAKNLPEGSTGAKKMLNLITGQVTHQSSDMIESSHSEKKNNMVPTLKEIVHINISKEVHSSIESKSRDTVCTSHFHTQSATNEDYYFVYFSHVSYKCVANRLSLLPSEHKSTLIETINTFMPHWTPNKKDNIVYVTIDEAMSGSVLDIESYLLKLKQDLHIGEEGYPTQVTIAGDQQTYALMKDIQRQHQEHYSWFIVLPGDWHMLKLLSEIIRDVLWDGGLKQLSYECGHKKLPTQWQEINMLLLALYETLLRKALLVFSNKHDCELHAVYCQEFWTWIENINSASNEGELSRFWAGTLLILKMYVGYYVAIRSGNWLLRNSCLKESLPLLFAYNHNKYEELSTMAILDTLTLPDDLLKLFLKGGWTVSVKGRPYHNIAFDEAHESVINLRLKTITSRPSHFRTVELADFMSYLDKVVTGFEGLLFRHKQKEPVQFRKRYVCQRTKEMIRMLSNVPLFTQTTTNSPLCNPLSNDKKTTLDSSTIYDLLNIVKIGCERMEQFITQYILPLPSTGPRKRRKRNRKLATFTRKSSTKRESKTREKELNNIATNAMAILQSHGITAQTCTYPLAISDVHGNMRSSQKSQFLTTLTNCIQFDQAVSDSCQLLLHPPRDLIVVIDLLYFIHMPPPPTILTFSDYFDHLWHQTIRRYAIRYNACHVYLIIDKPDFLPPPRDLVHHSRANKSNQDTRPDPVIEDDQYIPHNKTYSSLLSKSSSFKTKLIDYLSSKFFDQSNAVTSQYDFSVTIDTPSFSKLVTIKNGNATFSTANEHGEADYAIWHHCIRTTSNNILIVSSDTDSWVYGLGLRELQYLEGKQVYVQRGHTESFISINHAVSLISNNPQLSSIHSPVLTLVALYVLTGCDYVSSFYMCTKTKFLEAYIHNKDFIGCLLKLEGGEFQYINEEAWIRLVTVVYYTKFLKTYFRSKPVSHTYNVICNHSDSQEALRMLSGLNYSPDNKKPPLKVWHEFMRRVTYHVPKVTKLHEQKLIPSIQALTLHSKRANYVLKLVLSSTLFTSPFLRCFEQFGWHKTMDGCGLSVDCISV